VDITNKHEQQHKKLIYDEYKLTFINTFGYTHTSTYRKENPKQNGYEGNVVVNVTEDTKM